MTHPFHPLFGRRFEFVSRRRNWGEDRVYYHDEQDDPREIFVVVTLVPDLPGL